MVAMMVVVIIVAVTNEGTRAQCSVHASGTSHSTYHTVYGARRPSRKSKLNTTHVYL